MKNIGMIGCGNMGSAILKGYLQKNPDAASLITVYDLDHSKADELRKRWPEIKAAESLEALTEAAELILIAVKPQHFKELIDKIGGQLNAEKHLIVSIAVGVPVDRIRTWLDANSRQTGQPAWRIVRVMPNTPALIGQGMSALCRSTAVSDADFREAIGLFKAVGRAVEIPEQLMHAVVGVSGSGPAYVYMFIEALADGAVAWGLSRSAAYEMAAQTVLGAAAMVLNSEMHPGQLKDMVCSPGGTTIQAVAALEEKGLRNAVLAAVEAAAGKSKEMDEQ